MGDQNLTFSGPDITIKSETIASRVIEPGVLVWDSTSTQPQHGPGTWTWDGHWRKMPHFENEGWLWFALDELRGIKMQIGEGAEAEIIRVTREHLLRALCNYDPEILKKYTAARLANIQIET